MCELVKVVLQPVLSAGGQSRRSVVALALGEAPKMSFAGMARGVGDERGDTGNDRLQRGLGDQAVLTVHECGVASEPDATVPHGRVGGIHLCG